MPRFDQSDIAAFTRIEGGKGGREEGGKEASGRGQYNVGGRKGEANKAEKRHQKIN